MSDLDDAVARWLAGAASDEDAAAVSAALCDDPALRDRLAERVLVEAQLHRHFREAAASERPGRDTRRLAARARHRTSPLRWALPLAAAAAMAMAAVLAWPRPHGPAPFGTIVDGGKLLMPGDTIASPATIELTDGQGRLRLTSGTLLAPAPGEPVRLVDGRLEAEIAKRRPEEPLLFAAPHAEVEIIGTRFILAVEGERTRLSVTEGRVRAHRIDDGASAEVAADQVLLLARAGRLAVTPATAEGGRLLRVGAGQAFARFSDLPPLAPGDVIEVAPGIYREFIRLSAAGTAERPITLRGVGDARLDGGGVDLDAGISRALVQVESDHCVVEGLRLSGARNRNGNAAGVRVLNAATATIRGCEARDCDQGINIHDCGAVAVERCLLVGNGSLVGGGTGANLSAERLDRLAVGGCRITDARGDNLWCGARSTEIRWSWIADGGNSEIDLLSAAADDAHPHDALIVGSVIRSKAERTANLVRCIAFGTRAGGSLTLVNDTVVSALPSVRFLEACSPTCTVDATNCIFAGRAEALTSGTATVRGAADWIVDGCAVPDGLTRTLRGADPQLDTELVPLPGSPCIDQGVDARERAEEEPRRAPQPTPRKISGRIDLGACEYSP